jgi:hypothetical protein
MLVVALLHLPGAEPTSILGMSERSVLGKGRRQRLKMLIDLEGAHVFRLSIFGGVERLPKSSRVRA